MPFYGRTLPWNRPLFGRPAAPRRRPSSSSSHRSAKRAKTLSSQPSSSQSSVSGGYSARRPILIDSDDDDDFNEIFSQSQPIEVDDYVSLGHIGTILLALGELMNRWQDCGGAVLSGNRDDG